MIHTPADDLSLEEMLKRVESIKAQVRQIEPRRFGSSKNRVLDVSSESLSRLTGADPQSSLKLKSVSILYKSVITFNTFIKLLFLLR